MGVPLQELDSYLAALLADEDADAFSPAVRTQALTEAVIAIARLQPDEFAVPAELPWNEPTRSYVLADDCDRILQVIGLQDGDDFYSLGAETEASMINNDQCWRSNGTGQPVSFVWNSALPRHVYVTGEPKPDAHIVASVMKITQTVTDNAGAGTELDISRGYIPSIIDHAVARLLTRIDTAANHRAEHMGRFYTGLDRHNQMHGYYNPERMGMSNPPQRR